MAAAEWGAFAALAGAGTGGRDFSGISRATCSGHSNTFCHGARRMLRILNEPAVPAQAHKHTHPCMPRMHACTHVHTDAYALRGCDRAHTLPSPAQIRPTSRLTSPNRGGPARIPRHEEERASGLQRARQCMLRVPGRDVPVQRARRTIARLHSGKRVRGPRPPARPSAAHAEAAVHQPSYGTQGHAKSTAVQPHGPGSSSCASTWRPGPKKSPSLGAAGSAQQQLKLKGRERVASGCTRHLVGDARCRRQCPAALRRNRHAQDPPRGFPDPRPLATHAQPFPFPLYAHLFASRCTFLLATCMPRLEGAAARTERMGQVDELQCKKNRDSLLAAGSPRLCCRGLSPTFLALCALQLMIPSACGASNRR